MNEASGSAGAPERLARQYTVSWSSMLRLADALWEHHADRLVENKAGPEDLVALFGLSYVVEQLESSWDLNTLCHLRSAKTTLRSSLEGLFQLTAVASAGDPEERRRLAIQILGQELTQQIWRLEQIREMGAAGTFDATQLDALEAEVRGKSDRFKAEFGMEPTRIPITKLAEMGGISGHFAAYMDDKMYHHSGLNHLENDPDERESLQITHECCEFLHTALSAASHLLGEDMAGLLEPHERRIRKLKSGIGELYPESGDSE